MTRKPRTWMRAIASVLCAALLLASPGPSAYAVVAKVVTAEVNVPVGTPAAAGVNLNSAVSGSLSLSRTGLAPTLAGSLAPTIAAPAVTERQSASLPQLPSSITPAPAQAAAVPAINAAPLSAAPAQAPEQKPQAATPGSIAEQAQALAAPEGKLAAPAAKVRSGFLATLRSIFSGESVEDVPGSVSAEQSAAKSVPALKPSEAAQTAEAKDQPPAPAPEAPKKSKAPWLGLGVAGFSIIGYALSMQIGLEAQGVAMPQLTENAFKDFTLLPLVTVFASIGSMIGQPMSKFFTERFGFAKTFYAAQALRAVSLGAMVALFGFGYMTMPMMMAFYLVNGIVTGISVTAEGTLRKLKLAESGVSMQTFRTWWQLLAETLAVPAPIFFGALVHTLGAVGAPLVTAVYPITILLGLLLAYILRVYPLHDVKKASEQAAAAQAAPKAEEPVKTKKGVWAGIKNAAGTIFRNMEEGKNYVMGIPYLKYSLLVAAGFDLFNTIIYRLIAPGYGKMTGGAAGLSAVQGNIVGMFSLGGLLLSVVFIAMESLAKKRAAKNPQTPEQAKAAERSSLLRWTMVGIPAIGLLATMAFQIALPFAPLIWMGTNWMPSSMLAAALIPFGFFQVAGSIKANSYYQESLPADAGKVQKALAFSGSVATALAIATLLMMRPLFSAVNVFNPFPWIALGMIPLAGALLWLWSRLSRATKPEAIAAADAEAAKHEGEGPHKPGAYVGIILGVVAAALVITALPMIPPVAAAMAGWTVLGKFALNVGLTMLFPAIGALIGRAKQKK